MSGSNALAAAKRRRGGSEPKGPAPPGSRNVQNNSQQSQSVPPAGLNPLQLVAFNHQRLNKLADELPKSIDSLGESFNALSSNCDYLHDQFTELEKKVGLLMSNQASHVSSVQPVSSSVDSSRFEQLGRDVDEVHRVITRMQSFAMDLSNSIAKTKDQFDNYTSNVNSNMNQLNARVDMVEQKINHLYSVEQRLVDASSRLDKLDNMFENLVNANNANVDDDDNLENESQEVEQVAE